MIVLGLSGLPRSQALSPRGPPWHRSAGRAELRGARQRRGVPGRRRSWRPRRPRSGSPGKRARARCRTTRSRGAWPRPASLPRRSTWSRTASTTTGTAARSSVQQHFDDVLSSRRAPTPSPSTGWASSRSGCGRWSTTAPTRSSAVVPSGFDRASRGLRRHGRGRVALGRRRFPAASSEKLHSQPIAASAGHPVLDRHPVPRVPVQLRRVQGHGPRPLRRPGALPLGLPQARPLRRRPRLDRDRLAEGRARRPERGYPTARALPRGADLHPDAPRRVDPARRGRLRRRPAGLPDRRCSSRSSGTGWRRTGETSLCLAGGTFLNCKSNSRSPTCPAVDADVRPARLG